MWHFLVKARLSGCCQLHARATPVGPKYLPGSHTSWRPENRVQDSEWGPPGPSPCSAHLPSVCRDKWRCTGLHVLKPQQFAQVTPWLSLALGFTWPEAPLCRALVCSSPLTTAILKLSGVSPFVEIHLCWEQIFIFMALFPRWVPGQLARDCFPNQAVL